MHVSPWATPCPLGSQPHWEGPVPLAPSHTLTRSRLSSALPLMHLEEQTCNTRYTPPYTTDHARVGVLPPHEGPEPGYVSRLPCLCPIPPEYHRSRPCPHTVSHPVGICRERYHDTHLVSNRLHYPFNLPFTLFFMMHVYWERCVLIIEPQKYRNITKELKRWRREGWTLL